MNLSSSQIKPQLNRLVNVLVGGCDSTDPFTGLVEEILIGEFGDKYTFRFWGFESAREISRFFGMKRVDLFVPFVNSIMFPHNNMPPSARIGQAVAFVARHREMYTTSIIAFSGVDVRHELKSAGVDDYFPLPFCAEQFALACRACLSKQCRPSSGHLYGTHLSSTEIQTLAGPGAHLSLPENTDRSEMMDYYSDKTRSQNGLCLLLPFYFDYFYVDLFLEFGFHTLWSESVGELKRLIKRYHIDVAIEHQRGERDFPIRELLMREGKEVPMLLALNWTGHAPSDLRELGYRGTLTVPFDPTELLAKFFDVLPTERRHLIMETELWNDVLGE